VLKLPLPLKVYRWMRRIAFKCVSFWCENVDSSASTVAAVFLTR